MKGELSCTVPRGVYQRKLVGLPFAIKYLLRNKANFDILEGFLSELLKTPITIQQILESEGNKNHDADKYNRVDIMVKTADDKKVIVELQCCSQWDYLSRILYGTAKVVCEYLREGDDYGEISKVISVSIVFFNLGQGKDYLYHGTTSFKGMHYHDTLSLNDNEQKMYAQPDSLLEQTPETIFPEYYLIKVTKFQERVKDKFDEWVYFLKHGEIKKEFAAQGIQSAATKLDVLKLSEKDRRAYERYRESLHDDASFNKMIRISEEKGIEKGIEKGQRQERKRFVRALKRKGLSDAEIAAEMELSLSEVQSISEPASE